VKSTHLQSITVNSSELGDPGRVAYGAMSSNCNGRCFER